MEEPLLPHCNAAANGGSGVSKRRSSEPTSTSMLAAIFRLSSVLILAFISLWANYEASKGFEIFVIEAPGDTPAARHFNLMFVSNGRAARAILNASDSVERKLYPPESASAGNLYTRKPVKSVTLRVAGHNLTSAVLVTAAGHDGGGLRFVIYLSSSVIEKSDAHVAVMEAVYRGMARVWVNDGGGTAPPAVVEAIVEYLTGSTVKTTTEAACWGGGRFVRYCEGRRPGFVKRLNRAMEERWEEGMVDCAMGSSAQVMCAEYLRRKEGIVKAANSTGNLMKLEGRVRVF